MTQHRNFRRASRRFEMMVHDGVPESPQPMYQESTHGNTPSRLTGQPSDMPSTQSPGGTVAAVFILRDDSIIAEPPFDPDKKVE
jgi:hypothetical protein